MKGNAPLKTPKLNIFKPYEHRTDIEPADVGDGCRLSSVLTCALFCDVAERAACLKTCSGRFSSCTDIVSTLLLRLYKFCRLTKFYTAHSPILATLILLRLHRTFLATSDLQSALRRQIVVRRFMLLQLVLASDHLTDDSCAFGNHGGSSLTVG